MNGAAITYRVDAAKKCVVLEIRWYDDAGKPDGFDLPLTRAEAKRVRRNIGEQIEALDQKARHS